MLIICIDLLYIAFIFGGEEKINQPISMSPLMPSKTITPYVLQVDWNQLWLIHNWVFLKRVDTTKQIQINIKNKTLVQI